MASQEKKGEELLAEAEKKSQGARGFLGSLTAKIFGNSSQLEDSSELYVKAANCFKMAKNWNAAGNAFCESAKLQTKLGNRHQAASQYADAANCFRKSKPLDAVKYLQKSIEIYLDMGRFHIAGKHHQTVAEICESENLGIDKAMSHYEQAADYFKGEESSSAANRCLLKVARFAAEQEDYARAISIYEEVAFSSCENSLLKYAAKGYFFNAVLCHLCMDVTNAAISLRKYENVFPVFSDSRECKLIKSLLCALESDDVDQFSQAVHDFDSVSRIDSWTTTMLLRVKKTIDPDQSLR